MEQKEELLNELLAEERLESTMIEMYQMLLETGLENCFSEKDYQTFKDYCDILIKESEEHKRIVSEIIKKYI